MSVSGRNNPIVQIGIRRNPERVLRDREVLCLGRNGSLVSLFEFLLRRNANVILMLKMIRFSEPFGIVSKFGIKKAETAQASLGVPVAG